VNENQLRQIFQRTQGHCHFCGDPVDFEKRGWHEGDLTGYWEIDHIIQRAKDGAPSIDNCLPACTMCNRLRWHRRGQEVRELLQLGLIARDEVAKGSELGRALLEKQEHRLAKNVQRRKNKNQ
jgi:5-methylcytosine-specific restriction endonuclease McrA